MSLGGAFPIENSDYYKVWLREREEILKHQWVLGERNRAPVTYEYAQWDWLWNHRSAWLAALKASGEKVY